MKYFVYQGNESDCGFASLKMLLAILSKNRSYLNLSKPDKKANYSINDLTNIAEEYGVILDTYKCADDYYENLKTPSLVLINKKHLVLLKKVRKNSVIIYDPGEGIIKIKKDEFLKIWDKIILEVSDSKNIMKIKKIKREILPLKMEISQILISTFSTIFLICGFYFLNDVENFYFLFIFLGVFLLSQFIENFFVYKQLNYFDEHYIPLYFDDDKNCTNFEYEKFLNFKREYFVAGRGVLTSILLAFILTFLLCLNDIKNLFVILIIVLIKIFDLLINSKNEKASINEIGKLEEKGLKNSNSTVSNLLIANKLASKKVFGISLKNLSYIFICFLLSIGTMILTGNSGCNFVIFHFALYYACYKSYSEMLEYASRKDEFSKRSSQFFDKCNL